MRQKEEHRQWVAHVISRGANITFLERKLTIILDISVLAPQV